MTTSDRPTAQAPHAHATAAMLRSLAERGDLSGMSPEARAALYEALCTSLGLNPHTQPFAFLRLNGKEVLYATRGATDQLAAIHMLNREIVEGPRVIDVAGTRLVYAVCRATMPDGRFETATATVALIDPVNVLMKCETKAKRRVTLSILGLGALDDGDLDGVIADRAEGTGDAPQGHSRRRATRTATTSSTPVQSPVDAHSNGVDEDAPPRGVVPVDAPAPEVSPALEAFLSRLDSVESGNDAVVYWRTRRMDVASMTEADRTAAWNAINARLAALAKTPKGWLKRALAQADATTQASSEAVAS